MTRRIHTLHLRGGSASDQQRAVTLVADALRTASIPGLLRGRVLVVRRLDLGTVSVQRASQALALRITDQVRRLGRWAAHGEAEPAAAAPAVWFPDRAAARAAFLARRVAGPPPRAWFWPGAVADERPSDPVPALLGRWLAPQARLSAVQAPALVVVARQIQAIVAQGPGPARAILAAIPAATAARWAPAVAVAAPVRRGAKAPPTATAPDWAPILAWAAAEAPAPVARLVAAAAGIAADPTRVSRPDLGHAVDAVLRAFAAPEPAPARPRPLPAPAPAAPPVTLASPPPRLPPLVRLGEPIAEDRRTDRVPVVEPTGVVPAEAPARPIPDAAPPARFLEARPVPRPHRARLPPPPPLTEPARTSFGGLLFQVNPLARLGFAAVAGAADRQAEAFGWRVLDALGARLGAPPDDPVLRAVAPPTEPAPLEPAPYVAPAAWWAPDAPLVQVAAPDGVTLLGRGGVWLARWSGMEAPDEVLERIAGRPVRPGPPIDASAAAAAHADLWAAAAIRWCAEAGLDAAEVARRDGIVSATPTHVDVVLPIRAVALPIRRWALDADPGWVPWLGRVIAFHYVEDAVFDEISG